MKKLARRNYVIVQNLSRSSPPPAGERRPFARKMESNRYPSFPGTERARKDEHLQLTPRFNDNISASLRMIRSFPITKISRLPNDLHVLALLTEVAMDENVFAQGSFIPQSCAAKSGTDLYSIVKNHRFASVSTALSIMNSPSLIRNESQEGYFAIGDSQKAMP